MVEASEPPEFLRCAVGHGLALGGKMGIPKQHRGLRVEELGAMGMCANLGL